MPVAVDATRFPLARAPEALDVDFATDSLYDVLERSGHPPVRAAYAVEAVGVPERVGALLELRPGDPVLVAETTAYDAGDRLVELARTHYRGDRYPLPRDARAPAVNGGGGERMRRGMTGALAVLAVGRGGRRVRWYARVHDQQRDDGSPPRHRRRSRLDRRGGAAVQTDGFESLGPIELNVWSYDNQDPGLMPVITELTKQFMAKYPNVKINLTFKDFNSLVDTSSTARWPRTTGRTSPRATRATRSTPTR